MVCPTNGFRPAAYFTVCLPEDRECNGLERHREKIVLANGFWIGRTEVSQAAYKRVMNATPSFYKGADLPADPISWTDATDYFSRIGMRLPTESEWEWAAYGGTAEPPKKPLGFFGVVRPQQQRQHSSRSYKAGQQIWTLGPAGKCLGMGAGRRQRAR